MLARNILLCGQGALSASGFRGVTSSFSTAAGAHAAAGQTKVEVPPGKQVMRALHRCRSRTRVGFRLTPSWTACRHARSHRRAASLHRLPPHQVAIEVCGEGWRMQPSPERLGDAVLLLGPSLWVGTRKGIGCTAPVSSWTRLLPWSPSSYTPAIYTVATRPATFLQPSAPKLTVPCLPRPVAPRLLASVPPFPRPPPRPLPRHLPHTPDTCAGTTPPPTGW